MKYKEFKIQTTAEEIDLLADKLTALGIEGLIINDPKELSNFDESIAQDREAQGAMSWDFVDDRIKDELSEAWISFYIGESEALPSAVSDLLKDYDYKLTITDDEDWLHKWEEYYVPMKLSEHVVVKPVWREYDVKEGEILVNIDPGLAFGTGTSPTTYLAVRLLEKYLKKDDSVLDVGCGSGILSVIAAKLGASDITASDLDPEAVRSTAVNTELNGCNNQVKIVHTSLLEGIDEKADLVVANITAEFVAMLAPDAAEHLECGHIFIGSGIIDSKEKSCAEKVQDAGFEILEIIRDDCWVALAARKL